MPSPGIMLSSAALCGAAMIGRSATLCVKALVALIVTVLSPIEGLTLCHLVNPVVKTSPFILTTGASPGFKLSSACLRASVVKIRAFIEITPSP